MTAVIRHGDRTPKQKMKMVVTHKRLVIFSTVRILCIYVMNVGFWDVSDSHFGGTCNSPVNEVELYNFDNTAVVIINCLTFCIGQGSMGYISLTISYPAY